MSEFPERLKAESFLKMEQRKVKLQDYKDIIEILFDQLTFLNTCVYFNVRIISILFKAFCKYFIDIIMKLFKILTDVK